MIFQFLDPFGAITAFIATLLFMRARIIAWPISMIAVCVNAYLYYLKGIYGDMGLEGFYLITSCYGWYIWYVGVDQHELHVSHITKRHLCILTVLAIIMLPTLILLLKYGAHSQVPYLDATTTMLSLLGQWLMCRKIIEGWICWFAADVLYGFLFLYKGIPFHSLTHWLYLVLAVMGYLNWRRMMGSEAGELRRTSTWLTRSQAILNEVINHRRISQR